MQKVVIWYYQKKEIRNIIIALKLLDSYDNALTEALIFEDIKSH